MVDLQTGTEFAPRTRTLGALELFLYSASVQIPHRIHYDRAYAREEGHPDVLVHGPFQAVCMVQHALGGLGDGWRATNVRFRNLRPVFIDVPFVCHTKVTEISGDGSVATLEILSKSEDGDTVFTSGEVVAQRTG